MHKLILAAAFFATALPLSATSVADPAGDYLPEYAGPANADLDILSASITRSTAGVFLWTRMAGAIGDTVGGATFWGVNRGTGFPGLVTSGPPAIGPASILFDAIVVFNFSGAGRIRTFGGGGFVDTPLDPGTVTIWGDSIGAFIPFALLPSTGFEEEEYGYVNWSRSALGSQTFIADFAPEDASALASLVPEPASWALMIGGFGIVGVAARRKRKFALERPTYS